MGLDRLDLSQPALGAYLDEAVAVPHEIAARYREIAGHERAQMMTHPELGALLEVLVHAAGGGSVLVIGTFVGISCAWMARGLEPAGHIDTLEIDETHADMAEAWFAQRGLHDRIQVHRGPAATTLSRLPDAVYDLCYIDADKTGYAVYLEHAVRLVRRGGLIVADNVLAGGRVAVPPDERDANARALAGFTMTAVAHPRLATAVLTVGDGVTLSTVL
jgi:predicted O-methyltransferase YrrM